MSNESKPWFNKWPSDVPKQHKLPTGSTPRNPKQNRQSFSRKNRHRIRRKRVYLCTVRFAFKQFANTLAQLGVKKGDRVALFLPNIPQFIIAYFGVLKAGAVVSAISPLHREREVEYQLNDSGAQTIVVLDTLCPIVENVKQKTALKNVIVTGLNEYGSETANPATTPNTLPFKELIEKASESRPNVQFNPAEDLAALQYTGGTTGTAKGAMLTHTNLVSNALAFAAWIKGAETKETFLAALPLFHIYGMTTSMNVPISLAAKMVLLPKFDPAKSPGNHSAA